MKNVGFDISHIPEEYNKGIKTLDEIASFKGVGITTAWAVILKHKTDEKRFELFGKKENEKKQQKSEKSTPKVYNVWNI